MAGSAAHLAAVAKQKRGMRGTNLGGEFIGPKSIARYLIDLVTPGTRKSDKPEPDMRRGMGRTVTRGGSVISHALPPRKVRSDDRIHDSSDHRRMGSVAWVHGDQMRVNWDDGTHDVRPVETIHDPIQDHRRSFDAEHVDPPPKLDAKVGGPRRPDTPSGRMHDLVASGAVVGRDRQDALAAARPSPAAAKVARAKAPFAPREMSAERPGSHQTDTGGRISEEEAWRVMHGDKPMPKKAASPAAAKVAKAKAAFDAGGIHARLSSATTREEAAAHLEGLSGPQLKELAKVSGTSIVGAPTKDAMKSRIVEHSVGFKLNSASIRGGSWQSGSTPAARHSEVEDRVRAAYREALAAGDIGYNGHPARADSGVPGVRLSAVRKRIGSDIPRSEVDDALRRLGRQDGVFVSPEANQKTLTAADREAAIPGPFGDQHTMLTMYGSSASPRTPVASASPAAAKVAKAAPTKRAAKAASGPVSAADLRALGSREEARALLSTKTMAELRAIDPAAGRMAKNKADLIRLIVEATAGTKLDSAAIGDMMQGHFAI